MYWLSMVTFINYVNCRQNTCMACANIEITRLLNKIHYSRTSPNAILLSFSFTANYVSEWDFPLFSSYFTSSNSIEFSSNSVYTVAFLRLRLYSDRLSNFLFKRIVSSVKGEQKLYVQTAGTARTDSELYM